MKVVTRSSVAKKVYKKWLRQYPKGLYQNMDDMTAKLKLLGENPDPDDIDKIIGNKSWTKVPECGECGLEYAKVTQVGEAPDYDSSTVYICLNCANKVVQGMT